MCLSHNIVCVNLGPIAVISRGEQNRYATLLTFLIFLIKFYGGLRLMKSTAAVGGYELAKYADALSLGYQATDLSVVFMIAIRGAPIMLWPIIGRPIIGAK